MGDLEWTNELVIRLMQEYKNRPELWNPGHEMYRVQTLKYESWRELAAMFECDIADLRKKLNSLFASHRREKGKVRAGHGSSWFLYRHMSFLPSHVDSDAYERVTSKVRVPIREAAPPSATEDDDDDVDDPDYCAEEEYLEEDELQPQTEVMIKEEPAVVQRTHTHKPPRRLKRREKAHAKPRLTRPIKRRIVKPHAQQHIPQSSNLDDSLAEALTLLRRSDLTRRKDECDSFGEYIADSLRKHDDRTQSMIKQAINNILFEQEMKKYNNPNQQYVVISSIDENPLILTDETEK